MATFDETMENYSEKNRLSFEQYVGMAAKLQDRHGVSSLVAMRMVEDTLAERQKLLDENAVAAGGTAYVRRKKP